MAKKWTIRWKREVEVFLSLTWCIAAESGVGEVHNFLTNEQICPYSYPERDWRLPPPCSSSPTASSCLLHWFRHSSALKETQGRVEDSNLHRPFFYFLFLSHFHCWSPLFSFLFFKQEREKLKRGTNKVFFFCFSSSEVKVWPVNGEFYVCFSLLSHLLPPPVKPSDNSGADRLAGNKKGSERWEFDSFFKRGTKYPPLFLPLCVSLSSHRISLFTIGQFIFYRSGISHLNETSSSRASWAFDWELGGLDALALWYPSTCHCPSSSPIFSSVAVPP